MNDTIFVVVAYPPGGLNAYAFKAFRDKVAACYYVDAKNIIANDAVWYTIDEVTLE